MKRTVLTRYGGGGGGGSNNEKGNGNGDGGENGEAVLSGGDNDDGNDGNEPAPGEFRKRPVRGLPRADDAPNLKESSAMWKRLGLALSSGFEEARRERTAAAAAKATGRSPSSGSSSPSPSSPLSSSSSSSLNLISDALAASSTDQQPEEHVSNVLTPRSHPRRRWEVSSYWSSTGSSDPRSGESLSFRLAHPLCVATALTLRPFEAYFQPGRPVYAPRFAQLASGRSDCWSEELVSEWERGRERRGRGQQGRRRRLGWAWGRSNGDNGGDDDGGDDDEEKQKEEDGGPPSPSFPLERFISTDERGLAEARTELLIDERRRPHPPSYPRFDGAFLRDNNFEDNGGGDARGCWGAAVSRLLPVRKSGRAQRLSLIGEGGEEEEEGRGRSSPSPPPFSSSSSSSRRRRRRQSGGGRGGGGGGGDEPISSAAPPPPPPSALLMTGGHARLFLHGRTQTQRHVDDLFYTCLSYVKIHGFAVRGLRVEFLPAAAESGGGAAATAATAAAATNPPPPRQQRRRPVPVLSRIPEGRDPLFDLVPGGISSVSERGRAGSRAQRRARALSSAGALFALPPLELSDESPEGTRKLAEALLAAADDSASDGEADLFGVLAEEEEDDDDDDEEEEEEEEQRGEGRGGARGGENGGGGGGGDEADETNDLALAEEQGVEESEADTAAAAKAGLVSGLLRPDGGALPTALAMRMVRVLAANVLGG